MLQDTLSLVVPNATSQEVFTRLDLLASKLGVASTALWEALVTQARLDAVVCLITASECLGLALLSLFVLRYLVKKVFPTYTPPPYEGDSVRAGEIVSIVAGAVAILGAISFLATLNIGTVATGFFNPEYAAVKEILSLF